MGEEVKKISFGFSKFTKKTQIVSSTLNQIKPEKNNVELIDCFEGKAIKLKNPVQPVDNILVIPLQRHQETKLDFKREDDSKSLASGTSTVGDSDSRVVANDTIEKVLLTEIDNENKADLKSVTNKILTLDEIAAKEILEDLNDKKNQDESRIFTVPLTNNPPAGENESSLEDYENIPVGDFGVAMLRGMGWAPGKGIGKNEKLVTPSLPTLRPKGMGLGADTVLKSSLETKPINKDLKMVKKSFIRVIAGQHKDSYGQIEGFDDETGRLIVKLALKNISISLNEFMVQLVDDVEFLKNSKVINVSKYEQYKEDESKNKPEKPDVNIHRKSLVQENVVEVHDKQYKGKQHRHSLSADQSTKSRNLDLDSPEKGLTGREIDKRNFDAKKSHKHLNKRRSRSRSSSSSSTNEKSRLKMSKDSFSKRSRSHSSSTSSTNSFRKIRKSSKSKHKYKDSDKRSSRKEKSIRKKKSRSSSSSSSSSSVSSNYDKTNVYHRNEKKMSSSKRYQSKRRSQSPRERDSSIKHRNKHR